MKVNYLLLDIFFPPVVYCETSLTLRSSVSPVMLQNQPQLMLRPLSLLVNDAHIWDKIGQKCALPSLPSNLCSANEKSSPQLSVPQVDDTLQCKKWRGTWEESSQSTELVHQGTSQGKWKILSLFRVSNYRNAVLRSAGWYRRVPMMLGRHWHSWKTVGTYTGFVSRSSSRTGIICVSAILLVAWPKEQSFVLCI